MQKWNLRVKLGRENLDCKKSSLEKVNGQQESQSQRSTPYDDVSDMALSDDISKMM